MDKEKLDFFTARYQALDEDAILELHGRRDTLAEEAIVALDAVLAEKGVNKDVLAHEAESRATAEALPDAELTKQLVRGKLAMTCKLVFLGAVAGSGNFALKEAGIHLGALWAGLFVMGMGYAGYRLGGLVTTAVCVAEGSTFAERKRNLWFLLFGGIVMYVALFPLVGAIARLFK